MSTALFLGRFQPLHRGHLLDIKTILQNHRKIIIIIGSAQEKRTKKNPFSAHERREMLIRTLRSEQIPESRFTILNLNDVPGNNASWIKNLLMYTGNFDIAYGGNDYVLELFQQQGISTSKLELLPNVSGTIIRQKIRTNQNWKPLVPAQVNAIIQPLIKEIKTIE